MSFTHQSINGKILLKDQALIPLTDLGLLRAYAIFDFFRVLNGVPVFLEDHLDRLIRSASLMDMNIRWSRQDLHDMIREIITVNRAERAGCRVVVTGGFSEDGYTPNAPNVYMMLHDLPVYSAQDVANGCKLISSAYVRDVPMVKTCIYVQSLLVNKKMQEAGAVEVLYHWKGSITECSRSNMFFITPEGSLVTPAEGMLHGITRKHVLAIAEERGIPVELREVHLEEVPWFREAFLTSSTRGVLPVTQIDKDVVGDGRPGELTMTLYKAFDERVRSAVSRYLVS